MKAIAAVDNHWGIGKNGGLLAHIPGDLKLFKEKTLGKTVVMGRKTLESLPHGRPLPGRNNIILSQNMEYQADCQVCHSLLELRAALQDCDEDDIFVIGGAEIYRQLLPECNVCYMTKLAGDFSADCFFINLDEQGDFYTAGESGMQYENGIRYRFVEYRRK